MTGTAPSAKTIAKYGKWLAVYGGGLILLGAFAIIVPGVATLAAAILLGWLFIAAGAIAFALPPSYANILMGASFGAMHIVFGAIIARRYGG